MRRYVDFLCECGRGISAPDTCTVRCKCGKYMHTKKDIKAEKEGKQSVPESNPNRANGG